MSRSLSWIDPQEVGALLDRAGVTSSRPAKAEPAPSKAPKASKATQPHFPAPAETQPNLQAPTPPDFDAPAVTERISALAAWLREMVGDSFYIADPQGLPIFTSGPIKGLVVSSVALERAIRSLRSLTGRRNVGAAAIELDLEQTLETVWTDTKVGRIAIGVFGKEPMPRSLVRQIRESTAQVFDWGDA